LWRYKLNEVCDNKEQVKGQRKEEGKLIEVEEVEE